MRDADLQEADLTDANLKDTNFERASLEKTRFNKAIVNVGQTTKNPQDVTIFCGTNFKQTNITQDQLKSMVQLLE